MIRKTNCPLNIIKQESNIKKGDWKKWMKKI